MADDTHNEYNNRLKFTPNLEHLDPFEGLSDGLPSEEELLHIRYGFRIANHNILIEKNIICEVNRNAFIYPIPNLPEWVLGMINLRGNLIPVINLGQLLLPDDTYNTARKTLTIIDQGEKAMGIYIDELPVSLEVDETIAEITSPDPGISSLVRDFTRVAYSINNEIWHEIDHYGMFCRISSMFNGQETDSQN